MAKSKLTANLRRGRPRRDKSICRTCGQSDTQTLFVTVRGEPQGLCTTCRSAQRRASKANSIQIKPTNIGLCQRNSTILSGLGAGGFKLIYRHSGAIAGTLTLLKDSILIEVIQDRYRLSIDFKNTALWLSNTGVLVTPLLATPLNKEDFEELSLQSPRELVLTEDLPLQRRLMRIEVERLTARLGTLGLKL